MLLIAALLATAEVRAQDVASAPPSAAVAATDAAPARPLRHAKGDPLEKINRKLYGFHQRADKALFRPIALFYKHVVPNLIRKALRHIISNLGEPLVFMNDVLQLKPKRAVKTLSRFAINSTVGIGGMLDIAKTAHLPHRENSLGDTLARYGVGPGPYLFIPFFGPTDFRDLFGGQVENLVFPLAIGFPFDRTDYQATSGFVAGLDLRAESDADFKALLSGAADPYATLRSVYQQSREAEIAEIKGQLPSTSLDDPLTDPEASPADPSATTSTSDLPTPPADAAPLPDPAASPAPTKSEPGDTKVPVPQPTPQPAPQGAPLQSVIDGL